jgi:hypothetical protein
MGAKLGDKELFTGYASRSRIMLDAFRERGCFDCHDANKWATCTNQSGRYVPALCHYRQAEKLNKDAEGANKETRDKICPLIDPYLHCSLCGCIYPRFFEVPNEDWERYVEPKYQNTVICRECYNKLKLKHKRANSWKTQTRR